ncbi:hypothetical protein [Acinetobacter lactucae]|uniref:hypothetical protein n=1 Tax=Acinetobacter lactucae TaxID=1785128 RepID=UPI00077E349A|nr:hypothetical protein [Acinetobacter lactucae]
MNNFFGDFDQIKINFIPYQYQPLSLFFNEIYKITNLTREEYEINNILEKIKKIINYYIIGKEIFEQEINDLRNLCKRYLSRSDLIESAKIIYKVILYIDPKAIIVESLENLILLNSFNQYGLIVENEKQWKYISELLKNSGLLDFLQPIFKSQVREKYFDIPIVTFFPVSWVYEIIVQPISENIFFIQPEFSYKLKRSKVNFKAPDNSSIEVESEGLDFIQASLINIDACSEFNSKFTLKNNYENLNILNDFFNDQERLLHYIEFNDKFGAIHYLEYNKQYITISNNNEIEICVFDNEDQINQVKYIIKDIDTSNLTSEKLKHAKNIIMEKWKKPLRDYCDLNKLVIELKKLGSIKATPQNVKNWYSRDTIAPRCIEDYKAVLLFSGINNNKEIERFLDVARKLRGDSISDGYERKVIGQEFIIDYLSKINSYDNLENSLDIDGILFSIVALG